MLCRVCGEEHLLLRQYFPRGNCIDPAICTYSLPLLAALTRRDPTPKLIPFYSEDSLSEAEELKDMTRLLASLSEAAQCLPEGSERGRMRSDRSVASRGGWRH